MLKGAGLHITGKVERNPEPVLLDGGNVAVYSIPFFNRDEITAQLRISKGKCGSSCRMVGL